MAACFVVVGRKFRLFFFRYCMVHHKPKRDGVLCLTIMFPRGFCAHCRANSGFWWISRLHIGSDGGFRGFDNYILARTVDLGGSDDYILGTTRLYIGLTFECPIVYVDPGSCRAVCSHFFRFLFIKERTKIQVAWSQSTTIL